VYLSNYFEHSLLNVMRGITFSAPAQVFLALFLTNPGDDASGTEISYPGYQRVPVSFSAPAWDVSMQEFTTVNTTSASYAEVPSGSSPGTVSHIAVFDSLNAGNMFVYGPLEDAIELEAGEAPSIVPGEIRFMTSGDMTDEFRGRMFNILRGVSIAGVAPHLALFNNNAEIVATNYTRRPITFNEPEESDSGIRYIVSNADIVFNQASTVWGAYNTLSILDASSGGNVLWRKNRGADKFINRLKRLSVRAGDLTIGVN